jgi:predicted ATP-dependent endonuclease of OLD family
MYLKSFVFESDNCKIGPVIFNEDLNVLFGRNATGKTRTLNTLLVLCWQHSSLKVLFPGENYLIFEEIENDEIKEYHYRCIIKKDNFNKFFIEQDSLYLKTKKNMDEKLIFDRKKKRILNEGNDKEEIYNPLDDELSLSLYIKDKFQHKTALKVKDFLLNIKKLDSNLADSYISFSSTFIAGTKGENLSESMVNIFQHFAKIFTKIEDDFKYIYPKVKEIYIGDFVTGNKVEKKLFIKEEEIQDDFIVDFASSGMKKVLTILNILYAPSNYTKSLTLIDELENGLDYDSLIKIKDILERESSNNQIIFTTHSPLFANAINFNKWIILGRNGEIVKFYQINDDQELQDLLKQDIEQYSFYVQELYNLREHKL